MHVRRERPSDENSTNSLFIFLCIPWFIYNFERVFFLYRFLEWSNELSRRGLSDWFRGSFLESIAAFLGALGRYNGWLNLVLDRLRANHRKPYDMYEIMHTDHRGNWRRLGDSQNGCGRGWQTWYW